MTIQVFSPKWFFHDALSENNQRKTKELFGDFLNNEDNFLTPSGWNCAVKTTWGHENNTRELWHQWLECIKPSMDRFIEQAGAKTDLDISMENTWANKSKVGDYQEIHDHSDPSGTNMSMVYFYQMSSKDDSGFRFYNQEFSTIRLLGIDGVLNTPDEQLTCPKVSNGDILIFPSHYLHLVSPHKGTKERITFSANFKITPVPVDKQSTTATGKDMDIL